MTSRPEAKDEVRDLPGKQSAPLRVALLAAAKIIAEVSEGKTLDDALAHSDVSGQVRAATQDLAYGALRRFGRGDFILRQLASKPIRDKKLRGLLLAGLYRLDDRPADAHTTVSQAVIAAGAIAGGHFKGLVNGLLRNALRQAGELAEAVRQDSEAFSQHPLWWLSQLQQAHPRHWTEIVSAGNAKPPMTLRVNQRRTSAPQYLAELERLAIPIQGTLLGQSGIRLAKPVLIERLPGFAEGLVSVQDWAAQQAAYLLDCRSGMRVLDACAAPGGKAAHLLESAGVDLLALEASSDRAKLIHSTLQRLQLTAEIKVADCRQLTHWWDGQPFDRILADVPCSASGVVRRHPDIKWLRRPSDIRRFASVQGEIINALWRTLAPGGKMLYGTCSVFAEENQEQIASFLACHKDAELLPTGASTNTDLGWQLLPDADQDGLYYALLAKAG